MIKRLRLLILLIPTLVFASTDAPESSEFLVTDWWNSVSQEEQAQVADNLIRSSKSIPTLYQWLRAGPSYSSDVPTGIQEDVRINEKKRKFRYVYVIPKSYDPSKSYPVEFMLHGGLGDKSRWRPGGKWWEKGRTYDKYEKLDQISVFPAAWRQAQWWEKDQAENLPAILRTLKKTYNIDDNRVYLSGVSDGGSGTFFFAFKQPSEWAAFLPYIGHPLVITDPKIGGKHKIDMENLANTSLFIVSGEKDRLYPSAAMQPYVDYMRQTKMNVEFVSIENGGHNTKWYKKLKPRIEAFKQNNVRDPFPERLRWVTENAKEYNRVSWLRIDELKNEKQSGWLSIARIGNRYVAASDSIRQFTIFLNPEEVDFNQPIEVEVNGNILFKSRVKQSADILLKSAQSYDRTQLYTAELQITVNQL